MNKYLLVVLVLTSALIGTNRFVGAQEAVTLTTPVVYSSNTAYHLERLTLDIDTARIGVQLKGVNGESLSKVYDNTTTPTGTVLLHALNIGNFSVNSMVKAVYTRLITDGVLTGTVGGAPQ